MDIINLTKTLINIPSITNDEYEIGLFIEQFFKEQNMDVRLHPVSENRKNVLVNYSERTEIIFCTHLDTVPPAIPSSVSEEMIYGRGACDAKGIIGSMIHTALQLKSKGENKFALLFVVGEEVDSIGAKYASSTGISAKYIIVGEPTENKLAAGQKGSLSYILHVKGAAGHSAYPESGFSAIHCLLDIIGELKRNDWGYNELLGSSTMNIGTIHGGMSANTIADDAEASVFHRLVDSFEKRKEQVRSIVGDRASIQFQAQNDPQQLHLVDGFESTIVNFGSDVPYLRNIGTPLLIGPGSIHDAHTSHEKISIKDLHIASILYEKLYFALLKED